MGKIACKRPKDNAQNSAGLMPGRPALNQTKNITDNRQATVQLRHLQAGIKPVHNASTSNSTGLLNATGFSGTAALKEVSLNGSGIIQKYPDLPRAEIEAWVQTHLLDPGSAFNRSVIWLLAQTKQQAQAKKIQWDKELTKKQWDDNPNLANTGIESSLSTMRSRFEVKDLTSSKYTIVSNTPVNLAAVEPIDSDDEAIADEMALADADHSGVLVSTPLYAGVQNFPARYVNGATDADKFSFILAYNAHGLTKGVTPVENAVARNELADSRGVVLGFYWEQLLHDTVQNRDVWTDDDAFQSELDQKASSADEKAAFASSLRHTKVLGTFPYGMWRNIAMNDASVNQVLASPWGQAHAPVMAHVTDPDASTWVDPFSNEHVAEKMTSQGNTNPAEPAHIVKGSYVYTAGQALAADDTNDQLWNKHIQNIANTASMLDALLRPALKEKVDLSYPAERNLMIRLKGVDQEASLYSKAVWRQKTAMAMTLNQTYNYDGDNTAFGLKDAEGKKLEHSVAQALGQAKDIVSSAAVTTEVPARVKSSIAIENYSAHSQSAKTGNLKAASNVKESLIANDTTEMISRARGDDALPRKMAVSEFRDRGRQLWESINTAAAAQGASPQSVTDKIDSEVDSWRTRARAEADMGSLIDLVDNYLTIQEQFINSLRGLFTQYHQFSVMDLARRNYPRDVLLQARDTLNMEIIGMEDERAMHADRTATMIEMLESMPGDIEEKTHILTSLKQHHRYYSKHAVAQVDIYKDIVANITSVIGA